ncbi:MAG: hypothetical protein JSV86_05410 [Gemmatimonadota bacterium]|nr:MAG: hypothetical protein JSV86_05410 [Gemmatimonadota bacterium]
MDSLHDTIVRQLLEQNPEAQHEVDYLVRLAQKNYCDGIIEEPRLYYDSLPINQAGLETRGDPDVFINGEAFPVRLTHLVMAARVLDQNGAVIDERFVQRVGLRLTFHDQNYMNRLFTPLPLWADVPIAAGDLVGRSVAAWRFGRPPILSARDTLQVTVALERVPAGNATRDVTVSFTGIGLLSKRPYFFSATVTLANAVATVLDTARFRPDGTEPVALTDMTVHCSALSTANDPNGDVREVRVQVRQVGNGTNATWFQGPITINPLPQAPAQLVGLRSGRSIVHKFPGDGLIWEPGEGITMAMQQLDPAITSGNIDVCIGLAGYLSVT